MNAQDTEQPKDRAAVKGRARPRKRRAGTTTPAIAGDATNLTAVPARAATAATADPAVGTTALAATVATATAATTQSTPAATPTDMSTAVAAKSCQITAPAVHPASSCQTTAPATTPINAGQTTRLNAAASDLKAVRTPHSGAKPRRANAPAAAITTAAPGPDTVPTPAIAGDATNLTATPAAVGDATNLTAVPARAATAPTPSDAPAVPARSRKTPVHPGGGKTMFLSNCTASPRGLSLRRGMVILGPREMRAVPPDERAEVRALFKCRTFQRFVDNGVFRLSELTDNDADVEVKTPPPPANLTQPVSLDGVLKCAVGPTTGERAARPTLIGYQQDLPAPPQNP